MLPTHLQKMPNHLSAEIKDMWKYGRAIIDAIFAKRTDRLAIYPGLESKVQADRDRGDIRMFETGLSAEQCGDHEHGTDAAAQEAESQRLITIAKAHGLFVPKEQWESFGDRKRLPSGESIVYVSQDEKSVVKVRNPFAKAAIKGLHPQDIIYEHLIHNILFPNTRYNFIGISEDIDGARIILGQPLIADNYVAPKQGVIDDYLVRGLDLKKEGAYFYSNDYIAITDVLSSGDNVISDGESLFFIDPIIKMKRPAVEILDHYYSFMK